LNTTFYYLDPTDSVFFHIQMDVWNIHNSWKQVSGSDTILNESVHV